MPPKLGGWGGGRGGGGHGGGGGASATGGGGRGGGDVKGREEIRKFLNFYKRRNSLCVDLYQPAFYDRKPNWEDLADFVYSVLAVGGTSAPQQIRAAVVDIQLHPVKKLLFLKFDDQTIRDEIATRLQTGIVWPAFATSVTGWGMDKPVERLRVLGVSPETDEKDIRSVLQSYGEIVEAKKGFISKKLPGCTNGIWTVKLILNEEKLLPPFLIMKEEGEVWQLATGEVSVCWKCGKTGHIGDKCHQDVSALAASLAGPAESHQPSWAHVVRGARTGPQCPRPPPLPPSIPRPGVLREPVTKEALLRVQLSLRLDPVLPPVRDENGKVIKFGKVLQPQVAKIVNETVSRIEKDIIEQQVEVEGNDLDKVVARVEEDTLDEMLEETVLYVNKAVIVENAVAKVEDDIVVKLLEDAVGICEIDAVKLSSMEVQLSEDCEGSAVCGAGAKLARSGSGAAVPASECSSVSPPRARKVAASKPGPSLGELSGGRIWRYKYFDVAFNDGTEHGGGSIMFCFDRSCHYHSENRNVCEKVEDYFIFMEDACTMEHNCLGRVMCVATDKLDHCFKGGRSKELSDLLSKEGDGCVMATGFTEVDVDKPKEN